MKKPVINLSPLVAKWPHAATNREGARKLRQSIARHVCGLNVIESKAILAAVLNFIVIDHWLPSGHDRCWENDRDLYQLIGLPFEAPKRPADFIEKCKEYCEMKMA